MSRIKGQRANFPSLMGAYLAVNAIADAYVLVDGPDCSLYKAHFIHGRHDLCSTLLDINGRHRVCFTNVCAQSVTKDHNELILRRLRLLDEIGLPGIILLTSLPGCSITGIDYDHLLRGAQPFMTRPALAIPPTSLAGDWLDGYGMTLRAIARAIDLQGGKPKPTNVALVGYMRDRGEGDHRANLRELRRLLKALGLDVVSVWLDGGPYAELGRVKDAGVIVSLPYGREAARELAERTGAKLVEASMPFGLQATNGWLRLIAEETGRQKEAEALIREETAVVFKRLQWIIPYSFLHKKVSYIGDPYLLEGFAGISEDLGMRLREAFVMSREGREGFPLQGEGFTTTCEPDVYHPAVDKFLMYPPDLLVSNTNEITRVLRTPSLQVVELGYPSYYFHALYEMPYLGFAGFVAFVQRMADTLSSMRRADMLVANIGRGNHERDPSGGDRPDGPRGQGQDFEDAWYGGRGGQGGPWPDDRGPEGGPPERPEARGERRTSAPAPSDGPAGPQAQGERRTSAPDRHGG
ncbi:MAG: hypothetical protein HY927_14655 [Elusimicrobia bacterium]|nr:hypothetical protein [Elusimicrobiota bacterium]